MRRCCLTLVIDRDNAVMPLERPVIVATLTLRNS